MYTKHCSIQGLFLYFLVFINTIYSLDIFFIIKLFIGISEVVMGGENVLQTLSISKYNTYPGIEDNEEEEEITESLDIHIGIITLKKYSYSIYLIKYFIILKNL